MADDVKKPLLETSPEDEKFIPRSVVTGFYKNKAGDEIFVDIYNNHRVRLYATNNTIRYLEVKAFKDTDYTLSDTPRECHVRMDGRVVGIFMTYYHAKLFLESLVKHFQERMPKIPHDSITTNFDILASDFRRVYGKAVTTRTNGKSDVVMIPVNLNLQSEKTKKAS